jgi:uncharacterized protein YjbI with pentapeptide repeats
MRYKDNEYSGKTTLTSANFENANLESANMELVTAYSANFNNANLNSVGFYYATLNDATFINADMIDVALAGARFFNANLTGAKLGGFITRDENTKFVLDKYGDGKNAAICPDGRKSNGFTNCGI